MGAQTGVAHARQRYDFGPAEIAQHELGQDHLTPKAWRKSRASPTQCNAAIVSMLCQLRHGACPLSDANINVV